MERPTPTFCLSPSIVNRGHSADENLSSLRPAHFYPVPKHISRKRPSFICSASSETSTSTSKSPSPTSVTSSQSKAYPDAGFIAVSGVTGTVCSNLFPIPILGGYGWFLSVYDRDVASSVGPFVVSVDDANSIIKLGFEPGDGPSSEAQSPSHKVFNGIAAGNLNVHNILNQMSAVGKSFKLKFFERGNSELFFQRRNELHVSSPSSPTYQGPIPTDFAPTYRIVPSLSSGEFEVRELYSGAGEKVKNPVMFEWFGMNLFPIFPLAKYSAFVCVWKQDRASSSVAIDKLGKDLYLSNFDPLPVPNNIESPSPAAMVAVRKFNGAASDQAVTENHRALIEAISKCDSLTPESEMDFRVVIDNTPNTLTPSRKNEIWVTLKMN